MFVTLGTWIGGTDRVAQFSLKPSLQEDSPAWCSCAGSQLHLSSHGCLQPGWAHLSLHSPELPLLKGLSNPWGCKAAWKYSRRQSRMPGCLTHLYCNMGHQTGLEAESGARSSQDFIGDRNIHKAKSHSQRATVPCHIYPRVLCWPSGLLPSPGTPHISQPGVAQ
jgi:hypothetical protein